jgi:hypothetical protein
MRDELDGDALAAALVVRAVDRAHAAAAGDSVDDEAVDLPRHHRADEEPRLPRFAVSRAGEGVDRRGP